MERITPDIKRVRRDILKMSEFVSSEEPGYTRISSSEEDREARAYVAQLMKDEANLSVRIDAGGITIVLNSISTSPNNIMHANAIGVYPEDYRMTVCKGGLAFREAYKPPIANTYIQSDTPGYSSSNLQQFTYTRIRRPMFPLDDI